MEAWQRNVWALALCVFIAFVGFQFLNPFLPLYVQELGVKDPARVALWSGLLAAITTVLAGLNTDIRDAQAKTFDDRTACLDFTLRISDLKHLEKVVKSIRGVNGVREVERQSVARGSYH